MSKQTNNQSRRYFLKGVLKGAAYTSAISISGISSITFAASENSYDNMLSTSPSSVTLFNQSDKTVALDACQPVSLEKVNGWVVVKINKASKKSILEFKTDEIITLAAGQQLAFDVDSELAPMLKESGDHIVITNDFTALNNMIPVFTHDTLVA